MPSCVGEGSLTKNISRSPRLKREKKSENLISLSNTIANQRAKVRVQAAGDGTCEVKTILKRTGSM